MGLVIDNLLIWKNSNKLVIVKALYSLNDVYCLRRL